MATAIASVHAVHADQVGNGRPLQLGQPSEVVGHRRSLRGRELVDPVQQPKSLRRDLLIEVAAVTVAVQRGGGDAVVEHLVVVEA